MTSQTKAKEMTKRIQTRRAIHMSATTYDEITRHAAHQLTSRSAVLEKLINDQLDKAGAPREISGWK